MSVSLRSTLNADVHIHVDQTWLLYWQSMSVKIWTIFTLGAENDDQYAPLHLASQAGHTAIIVALVEEGNADVNKKGGKKGDTALMLSVSDEQAIMGCAL